MATLRTPLSVQPSYLNSKVVESSKLRAVSQYIYEKKVTSYVEKIIRERKFSGEVAHIVGNHYQTVTSKVSATLNSPTHQVKQQLSRYLFRTENEDHVKVMVERKKKNFSVSIEVWSVQLSTSKNKLFLNWGLFRSDSSHFIPLESLPDASSAIDENQFLLKSLETLAVELEFGPNLAPFYLSFFLMSLTDDGSNTSEIRSHRNTNFCVPVGFGSGCPYPLGLSLLPDGSINFALFSRHAERVILCLYGDASDKPPLEIELDPYVNRSGDIWHALIDSSTPVLRYGYQCKVCFFEEKGDKSYSSPVLLDPYAKIIGNSVTCHLGQLLEKSPFDWGGVDHPHLPMEKLVVYRLNVMKFTKDKSSQVHNDVAGTFSGLKEKLDHFKTLGVNAVLLEPVVSFDEQKGPYFPSHFFLPMTLYGPSKDFPSTVKSIKEMVKSFHSNDIEVLLEVVFTHTFEGNALREIDKLSYYYVKGNVKSLSENTLNGNYPTVQQLILDSLRHWVTEYHIDGFVFINASSLLRGVHGEYLSRPPLIEAIALDPLLSETKIIADFWDPREMVLREINFPHWKRWAEINSKFCYDVRNYLRGKGLLSNLATRICGSGDIFSSGRGPAFSFNFIARNFGLPLVDLVSFSDSKVASELSWNCGEEGPTNKTLVLERRLKQIRNYLFILFLSLGVPVLNMGDECGYSAGGSPAYGDRKLFNWNSLKTGFGTQISQFISFLTLLRIRRSDMFQRKNFLREENIDWLGRDQSAPIWEDPSSKFLAMNLKADEDGTESSSIHGDLFIAFSASEQSESVILPTPPEGMIWLRLVDTALPFPGFFSEDGEAVIEQMEGLVAYEMESHSCVLFEAKRELG